MGIARALNAIIRHYPVLEGWLFEGMALDLQYMEATLLEKVISKALDQGIPVLTVHDAVIIEEQHADLAEQFMQEAYSECGLVGRLKIKRTVGV